MPWPAPIVNKLLVPKYTARINQLFGRAYNGLPMVRQAELLKLLNKLDKNSRMPNNLKQKVKKHHARAQNRQRQRNANTQAMRNQAAAAAAREGAARNLQRAHSNARRLAEMRAAGLTNSQIKKYKNSNYTHLPPGNWLRFNQVKTRTVSYT